MGSDVGVDAMFSLFAFLVGNVCVTDKTFILHKALFYPFYC